MTKERKDAAEAGVYQGSSRGFGFVSSEGGKGRGDDYFIPPRREGGAWNGDRVAVLPDPPVPGGEGRRTASVVKVLERANKIVTGTVRRRERELWLEPDSDRLPGPIKLVGKHGGVRAGEKAAAEIQSYGTAKRPAMGTLRETFGRAGSREAGVAAVLYHYEIDPQFPATVLAEARKAPRAVTEEALAGRLDLREKTVITIDGAASKDLDDAISLERDGAGNWVLGVHIADVSHYVAEQSALDLEAWERGTSVYFADRVAPMLPVELSNGICSLNPGVDRLALTCLMTLDKNGDEVGHSMHKSVIRSTERMTYGDCNALLEGEGPGRSPALEERYGEILPMLRDMAALAKVLEKRRKLRGGLELDGSESEIICDENGAPVEIRARKQGVSEALIESFMLAANECVARHLFERGKPAVYRVHEKPSQDKIEGLRTMLAPFGYDVGERVDSFALQKVLDRARETPEAPVISTIVLRSLMKARYDARNLGHFGLAAEYYCHFTSPIRRYPDLMVHRVLTKVIEGGEGAAGTRPWEKRMAVMARNAAVQASERELAAQSAEREIEKLYMAEFMQGHIGETFAGAASGVTKYGIFVALPSGVEGFLPVEALPGDRWHYDEGRMALRGERSGEIFSFGMALEVVCASADPGSGRIEFRLSGEERPVIEKERRPAPPRPPLDGGVRRPKPPRHRAGRGGKRGKR